MLPELAQACSGAVGLTGNHLTGIHCKNPGSLYEILYGCSNMARRRCRRLFMTDGNWQYELLVVDAPCLASPHFCVA